MGRESLLPNPFFKGGQGIASRLCSKPFAYATPPSRSKSLLSSELEVKVSDTGIGIPESALPLFDHRWASSHPCYNPPLLRRQQGLG